MTDKELKKLSRLELLELLLAETRENERLRTELEKIKQENTIKKSAQHLNETSENLGETTEKLGAALQQVSSIINSLDKVSVVKEEEKQDSSSVEVVQGDEVQSDEVQSDEAEIDRADEIQKEQAVSETNEKVTAVEDKNDSFFGEADIELGHNDISKRLDEALKLISSRIKEMDRLAGIVNMNKEGLSHYDD